MSSYFAPGHSYRKSRPEPTDRASAACFSGVAQPNAQRTLGVESLGTIATDFGAKTGSGARRCLLAWFAVA